MKKTPAEPLPPFETTTDYILGSDEVGFGSWAGPLVVCAALVSKTWPGAKEARDSKAITEAQREALFQKLSPTVLYSLVSVSAPEIDKHGVWQALKTSHLAAIERVLEKHRATGSIGTLTTIVDGSLNLPGTISLPKADALVPAVSIASIIAKVTRDRIMVEFGKTYPGYGFEGSKGYGTPQHQAALKLLGPCPIHRRSYGPVRTAIEQGHTPPPPGTSITDTMDLLDLLSSLPE